MGMIRRGILRAFKAAGAFGVSRALMRRNLRILCYHGFASRDEAEFRPQLFIRPETFVTRLDHLRSNGYRVLGLGEALEALDAGRLPPDSVVLTADDGFHNFHSLAYGILRERALPCTLYVTTYYMEKRNPVFRLAVQYLFWKSGREAVDPVAAGLADMPVPKNGGEAPMWDIIRFGEEKCDEDRRLAMVRSLAGALGQDAAGLVSSRMLGLMSAEEVREVSRGGIDIQLHTHRHRLPVSAEEVEREIRGNRDALAAAGVEPCDHFCYPSGIWSREHWPMLDRMGVKSSTTCEPGFARRGMPRHGLPRFLDSESISAIEFEAELCGLLELLRRITGKSRRIAGKLSSTD